MPGKKKKSKIRLLPHEEALLGSGDLHNISHENASSIWLRADSLTDIPENNELCYRHMADVEFSSLLTTNQLPETQPYQTLTRGQEGRAYCESYFRSNKYVDTHPTTVVEFVCPRDLIDSFYAIQRKPEDGTLSHGLGFNAGKTLGEFNQALANGDIQWRIVLVKRSKS